MKHSNQIFSKACEYIPAGVNSPVRSFRQVKCDPLCFVEGKGAWLTDVDGQRYVDYVGAFGPAILGHAYPSVIEAIIDTVKKGLGFGATHPLEVDLAEYIVKALPWIEKIRFLNSGTEACMTALRLARAYTKRNKIIKFKGGYHGHADALLAEAGSGVATFAHQQACGVPTSFTDETYMVPFNDTQAIEALLDEHHHEVAAIIVEPIAGNMGCIPPKLNFLNKLRQYCDHYGLVLIFDEVMTGFRVNFQGGAGLYQVTPDLTVFGKVIGGGMPVAAVGGKQTIMEQLAPLGKVYQAGTFSGHPVAMASGLATLKAIHPVFSYEQLAKSTDKIVKGIQSVSKTHGIPVCIQSVPGMFSLFFTNKRAVDCESAVKKTDLQAFTCCFQALLKSGIYLPPSPFESLFVSLAHDDHVIEKTLGAFDQAFYLMAGKRC